MAAFYSDAVLDGALGTIDNATALHIISGTAPADYAAVTGASLADVTLAGGDFAIADDATSGRKVTVAAKSGVTVDAPGTPTYYCLVITGSSTLVAYTEVNASSPDLTSGSTVDIPAVTFSVSDPTVV